MSQLNNQHQHQHHHQHQHPRHQQQHHHQHQHHHHHHQHQHQSHLNIQQQHDHIKDQLKGLALRIRATEEMLKECLEMQEQFVLKLDDRSSSLSNVSYQDQLVPPDPLRQEQARHELVTVESLLRQLATKIDAIRCQALASYKEIFIQLSDIQREVLCEHLPRWHLDQQLANNGVQKETNSLDQLQTWVDLLTGIIWALRIQLISMVTLIGSPGGQGVPFAHEQEMNSLGLNLNKLLETIVLNTFVVEKQPPQVMKTNTRFTSTVRYLCGPKLINVDMQIKPIVKVSILSENNARALRQRHREILQSNWSYLHDPPIVSSSTCTSTSISTNTNTNSSNSNNNNNININNNNNSNSNSNSYPPTNVSPIEQQQSVIYRPNQQQQQQQQSLIEDSFMLMDPAQQQQQPPQPHYMDTSSDVTSLPVTPQQQQFFQQQQQHYQIHPSQQQQQQHQQHQQHQQQQKQQQSMRAQYNLVSYPNNAHYHNQQQQQQQHQHQHQQHQQHHNHHQVHPHSHSHPHPHQLTNNKINMNEFDPSGEILNNSNQLEYQESTNQLVCHFRNMQLKKIKRTEKKGTESVMDEKFILVFHVQFDIKQRYEVNPQSRIAWFHHQGDLSFDIFALSLPVVVIVHGNQDPHAWATVTWHNAFARQDELLYQVPDKVSWRELGLVLSNKFRCNAGKGLNEQNLAYLASKISRCKLEKEDDIVSWNQFAKEVLPDMSFTFWEWFHSILKLTKDHLRELWNAERIYGFVGKKGCVDLLLGSKYHEPKPVGTFLLRYSETELGGISIAWVSSYQATNNNNFIQVWQRNSPTNASTNVIMHLQPFLSKDLQTRSLADRIRDLNDLMTLYPNLAKDDAFGSHYTPINPVNPLANGYIRPMLIQTLVANYPKTSNAGSISETASVPPATPNSFSQSSPDGIYQDNAFINDLGNNYSAYDPVN